MKAWQRVVLGAACTTVLGGCVSLCGPGEVGVSGSDDPVASSSSSSSVAPVGDTFVAEGNSVCMSLGAALGAVPRPAPESTVTGSSYRWAAWKDYLAAQSSAYLAAAEGLGRIEPPADQAEDLAALAAAVTAMADRLGAMLTAFTGEFPEADLVDAALVDQLFGEDYPLLNESMMSINTVAGRLGFDECVSGPGSGDETATPPSGAPGFPPNFRDELVRIALEQDVATMETDIPEAWLAAFPAMTPLQNGIVATQVGQVSGAYYSAQFGNGLVGFPIAVPNESGACDWAFIYATVAPASADDPPGGTLDVLVGTDTDGIPCSSDEIYWKYGTDFL